MPGPTKPPMNRRRTQHVMESAGVSALVLADPINIYHATGFWPLTVEMGQPGASIAVVPVDQTRPACLVTSQFLHYFQNIGHRHGDGDVELILYTAADEASPSGVAAPFFLRTTADGPTDAYERASRTATQNLLSATSAFPSPVEALLDVLTRDGLRDCIAVDGFLAESLVSRGTPIRPQPAEPLLRRIRHVKSAVEIALMRQAARNNAEAAQAAIASVRVGDHYEDVRQAFFAETGKRGGLANFLTVDSRSYEDRNGIICAGRCFMIDAVARYARYHGDYGRTVFVGRPEPALARAMDAAIIASHAISSVLAPGLRYSEITRVGRQAVADAGLNVLVAATPHSVGLFHTDEPFRDDSLAFAKADHEIEEDMVLSIDCPVLDTDLGGTVHLEDLWLVTAGGCEALNDTERAFLEISGS